jgi:hypothetical protein
MKKQTLIKQANAYRSPEEILEEMEKKCDDVLKRIKVIKQVKSVQ